MKVIANWNKDQKQFDEYAINYDAIVVPTSGAFVENYEDVIARHSERYSELESANNKLRAELASVNDEVRSAKNNLYDLFRKLADVVEPEVTHFSSDPLVNDPKQLVSMVIELLKQSTK